MPVEINQSAATQFQHEVAEFAATLIPQYHQYFFDWLALVLLSIKADAEKSNCPPPVDENETVQSLFDGTCKFQFDGEGMEEQKEVLASLRSVWTQEEIEAIIRPAADAVYKMSLRKRLTGFVTAEGEGTSAAMSPFITRQAGELTIKTELGDAPWNIYRALTISEALARANMEAVQAVLKNNEEYDRLIKEHKAEIAEIEERMSCINLPDLPKLELTDKRLYKKTIEDLRKTFSTIEIGFLIKNRRIMASSAVRKRWLYKIYREEAKVCSALNQKLAPLFIEFDIPVSGWEISHAE